MARVWLEAFILTQVIEIPIYMAGIGGRWWRRLALAFLASAITHPIVWFVIMPRIAHYWTLVAVAEGFAVAVETAYLWRLRVERAWRWALLANAASYCTGLLYYSVRGSPWG